MNPTNVAKIKAEAQREVVLAYHAWADFETSAPLNWAEFGAIGERYTRAWVHFQGLGPAPVHADDTDAGDEVQWGIRWPDADHEVCDDEAHARRLMRLHGQWEPTLVTRTVRTSPWVEVRE